MRLGVTVLFFMVLILGCKEEKHSGIYESGRIEYKITYLNADQGNFEPALLPRKMILEFNKHYCTNIIEGFMGMFRISNITSFTKRKSKTHLKVLNKNYIFYGSRNELMCCFQIFEDMQIKEDTVSKTLAGLKSNHAKVYLPSTDEDYDVYYTKDIILQRPNIANPYKDIDGVLTDFVLYMGPYKMRFLAQKFTPEENLTLELNIPDSAVKLTRNEMVYALDRLMK